MLTPNELNPKASWMLMLSAAAILMITMGARQTTGLFVSPLNTSTKLGIVTISFTIAMGQLVWGLAQPIFGAVADQYGPGRVIVASAVMLAIGTALTPFMRAKWSLLLTKGMLSAAGAGGSFFTCGFHIAFLATHLPGEVALCNLPSGVPAAALALISLFNIASSLTADALASRY